MLDGLTKFTALSAASLAVFTSFRDRNKGRLEFGKLEFEAFEKILSFLADDTISLDQRRKLEMASRYCFGATCNGLIIKRLLKSNASIDEIPYLIRAARCYLFVDHSGSIRFGSWKYGYWSYIIIILPLFCLALWLAFLFFGSSSSEIEGVFNFLLLLGCMIVIYLIFNNLKEFITAIAISDESLGKFLLIGGWIESERQRIGASSVGSTSGQAEDRLQS